MTDHDYNLQAPMCEDEEPDRECRTFRWFNPCPCERCECGVCQQPFADWVFMIEYDGCADWEEA